jgi:hypothetical protein
MKESSEKYGKKPGIQHAKLQQIGSLEISEWPRKTALQRWETKMSNCEVTTQATWLIAKPVPKRDGPKAAAAIHDPLGPILHPIHKANIITTT